MGYANVSICSTLGSLGIRLAQALGTMGCQRRTRPLLGPVWLHRQVGGWVCGCGWGSCSTRACPSANLTAGSISQAWSLSAKIVSLRDLEPQ